MKKLTPLLTCVLSAVLPCAAMSLSAVAAADDDVLLYGTMQIPYAEFYAAELAESNNAYTVDAVSSATTTKWSKSGEGELFEGTYNEANDDGTGKILGVVYPVAISQTDLAALGDTNFQFTQSDVVPEAYKLVTVENGTASFSKVQDAAPQHTASASATMNTLTPWGDYLIDFADMPEDFGAIYGAIVKTTNGNAYAMRHEQNIWRGELAWSTGFKTTEPHGNALDYKEYVSIMGQTITEISFITLDGYVNVAADLYVPIKFDGTVSVADIAVTAETATIETTNLPTDYAPVFAVNCEDATIAGNTITFSSLLPGKYTISMTDGNGVYAPLSADFLAQTDVIPAQAAEGGIVKTADASTVEFENYLKNITTVSVNGTDYPASGKRATVIFNADGTVNAEAASRQNAVFAENGRYELVITANGFTTPLKMTYVKGGSNNVSDTPNETTSATNSNDQNATTTTTTTTTRTTTAGTTAANGVKTSDAGIGLAAALLALSAVSSIALRKKQQ